MGHGIVLKGIVKYYGRGKNIPHTFGRTALNPLTFSLTNWKILRLSGTLLIDLPPLLLAPLFPLLTTRLIRSRDQEHVGYISICHIRMSTLNITIRQQTSLNGGASIARKSTQLMEGLVVSSSVASSVKRTEKYALFDD